MHASLFVWLVADGWCWFVLRETYCWLVADGWFVLREKYCCLVADKPSEQGANIDFHVALIVLNHVGVLCLIDVVLHFPLPKSSAFSHPPSKHQSISQAVHIHARM
jgi:hypothetical protein